MVLLLGVHLVVAVGPLGDLITPKNHLVSFAHLVDRWELATVVVRMVLIAGALRYHLLHQLLPYLPLGILTQNLLGHAVGVIGLDVEYGIHLRLRLEETQVGLDAQLAAPCAMRIEILLKVEGA